MLVVRIFFLCTLVTEKEFRVITILATWTPLCSRCLPSTIPLIPCFWEYQRVKTDKESEISFWKVLSILSGSKWYPICCGRRSSCHWFFSTDMVPLDTSLWCTWGMPWKRLGQWKELTEMRKVKIHLLHVHVYRKSGNFLLKYLMFYMYFSMHLFIHFFITHKLFLTMKIKGHHYW